ncbi:DNA recombination protein RmuC [Sphingomonas sp. HHU CXW]|uniref:DNA recombination protein RmuC homolog n=1 Tax=Sphingomonas hominis TaxID=2741495 RepID=A0ABX2JMS0_9SPHN|nr:DNA recombination protein RmuC [Sphingomonas hominis]NTS65774.1 DNA recombination protein RmuC [Sphingomonas hominis]
MAETLLIALIALVVGAALGWFLTRQATSGVTAERDQMRGERDAARAERDAQTEQFRRAIADLAGAEERARAAEHLRRDLAQARDERETARLHVSRLEAEGRAAEQRIADLKVAADEMSLRFKEVAQSALGDAQKQFLDRAEARLRQSEEATGQGIKALLQPVNDRLLRYEEGVQRIEAERRDAFGQLHGQIEAMRTGQERVSSEAAKLVNALRNAPKARGRWGEQQLRNVLESCGLAEHTDFQMEVSVSLDDGARLRPDAIVRIPGGKSLIIDAKVSLNAYQDAFGAVDENERQLGLAAHALSMRNHVLSLGAKAYWTQFDDAPDYVIMFVPGEHFLGAALEHDPKLWDDAFDRRVLLATPTNLIAIARTVSAVWRQEKLAAQAQEIATLGKELYSRLAVMGGHVAKLGKNLDTAMGAYNSFVGSLESQVLTSARRFEALNIDTGTKSIESLPVGEQAVRPLTKLSYDAAAE